MRRYGPHKEGSLATISLPHASGAALRHVLRYLHAGQLPSGEQDWRVLVEACSLSQQYLLPEVLSHTTALLLAQLAPGDFGPCLSYALAQGLDAVAQQLWLASPVLMCTPVSFHGYSAAAVSFCLDHTCSAATEAHSQSAATAGAKESRGLLTAPAAAEEALFMAVLQWCQQAAAGCQDCCASRKEAGGMQAVDACSTAEQDARSTHSKCTSRSSIPSDSCTGRHTAAADAASGSSAAASGGLQSSAVVLCEEHQSYLGALLARLNWQHLQQGAMQGVEGLQLLSQRALLQV